MDIVGVILKIQIWENYQHAVNLSDNDSRHNRVWISRDKYFIDYPGNLLMLLLPVTEHYNIFVIKKSEAL